MPKRKSYERRFHVPLFDIPFKTTSAEGKKLYSRLYMRQTRLVKKKK